MAKMQEYGRIVFNKQIAPDIFWMSVYAPGIAAAAAPGQFVNMRVHGKPSVQFLRMPFCIYDASEESNAVDICYQVVGEGTDQLSKLVSDEYVDIIGPIGNGWNPPENVRHALLVCGGVGAPALNLLGRFLAENGAKVDAVLGAQTASKLVCQDHFECSVKPSGGTMYITTDDGSEGVHGFVTEVTDDLIASGAYDYVAVCGPFPMERNVVRAAIEHDVFCEVSMEKLMACGVGACLGCTVETKAGRRRCCVDGPVFDAAEVIW